jgi:ketosteroid isomerase-like protein
MGEQQSTELVQRIYGSFRDGDIPAMLDSLSEDVQWVTAELEGVPVSGIWHGREQVGQFFQTLSDTQEIRQLELREFVASMIRSLRLGAMPGTSRPLARYGRVTSPTCAACAMGR